MPTIFTSTELETENPTPSSSLPGDQGEDFCTGEENTSTIFLYP